MKLVTARPPNLNLPGVETFCIGTPCGCWFPAACPELSVLMNERVRRIGGLPVGPPHAGTSRPKTAGRPCGNSVVVVWKDWCWVIHFRINDPRPVITPSHAKGCAVRSRDDRQVRPNQSWDCTLALSPWAVCIGPPPRVVLRSGNPPEPYGHRREETTSSALFFFCA